MSENQDPIILEAVDITKVYPGTVALDNASFKVRKGKVNVLIGENGAGKSTMMKIIAGVEQRTSGTIIIDGQEVNYHTPAEAIAHGVGIIYQELNLFPNLSIAENIFMTRELKKGKHSIDHKRQLIESKKCLDELRLYVDTATLVENLRVGQQQLVEIAKALAQKASILIMDEPTSALSEEEVEILFSIIHKLTEEGVSIVYISHRLEEIIHIGDYVTILRDGKFIDEQKVKDIDIPWIINKMTGGNKVERVETGRVPGDVILKAEHISMHKEHGSGYVLKDVSFELRKGEILGIYGLRGAGRTELLECLMGAHPESEGSIEIEGKPVSASSIPNRISDGFVLIPEDRKGLGILPNLNVRKNMTLASLKRYTSKTAIDDAMEEKDVSEVIGYLRIKVPDSSTMITSLSGGNQQKVIIGKSLLTKPKVLLMDEPTRGIDIGSKHDVFAICEQLAQDGLGIIFVSSEMQEMLAIPDRVIVLAQGRVKGEFLRDEVTEEKLVHASAIDLNAKI
ncbi:MAG: sugar ABC transporter ATP-binding protein [Spirochaetia bacterium]|nr:sugar ABC transporter ATP-binding protein [Spirochaetia bacterium]NCC89562.1 sugar ABC transporter ATP-binding protein [Spirochaetia bacterium]